MSTKPHTFPKDVRDKFLEILKDEVDHRRHYTNKVVMPAIEALCQTYVGKLYYGHRKPHTVYMYYANTLRAMPSFRKQVFAINKRSETTAIAYSHRGDDEDIQKAMGKFLDELERHKPVQVIESHESWLARYKYWLVGWAVVAVCLIVSLILTLS